MPTTPINIQIHLPEDLKELLKVGADSQKISIGEYLSWLIEAGLRDEAEYFGWKTAAPRTDTDYTKKIQDTIKRVMNRERKKTKNSRL